MLSTEQLTQVAQWLGIATIALAGLATLAFALQWSFRFRMVGVASFTGVLTAGVFALSLAWYQRPEVPGAVPFSRVFDNSTDQVVIAVPSTITPEQLEATLQQASFDLYSPGRTSPDGTMTIRARTILHPQPGLSQPVYLGVVRRSMGVRNDVNQQIEIDRDTLVNLPKNSVG
ncbi:Ycf51 family protein [Alkalinema sp. FACHB-956]|uniref:Ycf51 family protein n=1 Tax=Alkalinema sp. FACHB-956 TaxID=2692768 RepID=UPI00168899A2|nr:Ycf51 family protein [Alkalinema sp. FACHB-956]MBD2327745.1 Ycf51 family protein [Alkalinema sp. FACHB-956]